jgi:hypothetical protein
MKMNIDSRLKALEGLPQPDAKAILKEKIKGMTPEQREARYQELKAKLLEPVSDKIKPESLERIITLKEKLLAIE